MFDRQKWLEENKAILSEKNKEYRKENEEILLGKRKIWQEKNVEHLKEYKAIWYQKNKEKILKKRKENYYDKQDKNIKYSILWNSENSERRSEICKRYAKKHNKTEKWKANQQRTNFKKRNRMKNIINTLTSNEWLDILKEYDYKCAYCGRDFDENNLPTRDHVMPISKGGDNTKENIVPACRSCNCKKYNKLCPLLKEVIL